MAPHAGIDADRASHDFVSAIRSPRAHVLLWSVAVVLVALDLWSKNWAFSRLPPEGAVGVIPGVLEFRRSLNDGAVFGSFTGYVNIFIIASVLAIGFVTYLFAQSGSRQWFLHACLGMIVSGALGNLYDRAFVQADVLRFTSGPSQGRSVIGVLVEGGGEDELRLDHWPPSGDIRTIRRNDVTVRQQGVVRDFLKFTPVFPTWVPRVGGQDVWPWVFNVADAALVSGVIGLLLHSIVDHQRMKRREA